MGSNPDTAGFYFVSSRMAGRHHNHGLAGLLLTLVASLAATAEGQTVDVLDFRPAAVQFTLTNSSTQAYTAAQLNLLAKLGTKTQGHDSKVKKKFSFCLS
jgi:hypothetical protein